MNSPLILASFLAPTICFSQVTNVQTLIVDSGKYEFKQQAKKDTPDYSKPYRILSNQVKENPNDAELRYFLGYTIDRLNSNDGANLHQSRKDLTIKASEQFEEVNRLQPVYQGEIFILDPYSKLSSIWGSLAIAYLNIGLLDSAKWAFNEGKKRGGFIEPMLEYNRQLLNSCRKNSILVTYGDGITMPVWYLQTIENYRNDITAIDANLMGTDWYPKYLKSKKNLKLSLSMDEIDSIEYVEWMPQQIKIVNPQNPRQTFSWEIKPSYMGGYLLKGDRILLDAFKQNFFSRSFYFLQDADSAYDLSLNPHFVEEGLVRRVSAQPNDSTGMATAFHNLATYNINHLKEGDILKSPDAIFTLNIFRWVYHLYIYRLYSKGKYEDARQMLTEMTRKFPKYKLPFVSEEVEKQYEEFFQQVNDGSR